MRERREEGERERKPTSHPSRIITFIFGVPGVFTTFHSEGGIRSPFPELRLLSYAGTLTSFPSLNASNNLIPNSTSCVPGSPRCWIRVLVGWEEARRDWAEKGR